MIKRGSLWTSADDKEFAVIDVVETDGHTWVHYRDTKTCKEFSCYEESFVFRLKERVQ